MGLERNAKIYIAGHRGLVGSAIVRVFAANGCSNLVTRARADMELSDAQAVDRFFERERPDYVVLAAGRVGGIMVNRDYPADFISENLAIEVNVMRAAQRCGVKRLVFFASSCMYPREAPQPMAEDQVLTGRPEPTSIAYAIAKLAGTEMCLAYNRQFGGQRFVPLIPNSVYGPNDNFDPAAGHVLSALIHRFHAAKLRGGESVTLWGSGAPRREFLYADDLAAACLTVLGADLTSTPLPMNVGPGTDVSIRELATIVARVVGFEGTIEWDRSKPDGAPRKLLDSARMCRLGWRAEIALEAGVRKTYDWYRDHLLEKATT